MDAGVSDADADDDDVAVLAGVVVDTGVTDAAAVPDGVLVLLATGVPVMDDEEPSDSEGVLVWVAAAVTLALEVEDDVGTGDCVDDCDGVTVAAGVREGVTVRGVVWVLISFAPTFPFRQGVVRTPYLSQSYLQGQYKFACARGSYMAGDFAARVGDVEPPMVPLRRLAVPRLVLLGWGLWCLPFSLAPDPSRLIHPPHINP